MGGVLPSRKILSSLFIFSLVTYVYSNQNQHSLCSPAGFYSASGPHPAHLFVQCQPDHELYPTWCHGAVWRGLFQRSLEVVYTAAADALTQRHHSEPVSVFSRMEILLRRLLLGVWYFCRHCNHWHTDTQADQHPECISGRSGSVGISLAGHRLWCLAGRGCQSLYRTTISQNPGRLLGMFVCSLAVSEKFLSRDGLLQRTTVWWIRIGPTPFSHSQTPVASPNRMIYFITGGERSGKSRYAQQLALGLSAQPVYLATARKWDADFENRIQRHQQERDSRWINLEEEKYLSRMALKHQAVVIDCVTLWLTNFYTDHQYNWEAALTEARNEFDLLAQQPADFIIISNEIGMGVHADTAIGRKFVELQGWMNQHIAARADQVFFMVSGIALKVK